MRITACVIIVSIKILYFSFIRSPIVIPWLFSILVFSPFVSSVFSISLIFSIFSSFLAKGMEGANPEFSILFRSDSLMFILRANSSCVICFFVLAFLIFWL